LVHPVLDVPSEDLSTDMKPVLAGDIETKRIAQEKVVDAILPSGYAVGEQAPLHSVSCQTKVTAT
jgi:hypothetical protein